jgi:protein-L-isoaspartate(D-aspartate) O-methyltransferase
VGTGSGYQAAVLAELVRHVYSIEIVEPLSKSASERLAALGYRNVTVRIGDGYRGWPEHAPFDGIIVTAAAPSIPEPLIAQLKPAGRMVIPVESARGGQELLLVEKKADGTIAKRVVLPVRFVPMTGKGVNERRR